MNTYVMFQDARQIEHSPCQPPRASVVKPVLRAGCLCHWPRAFFTLTYVYRDEVLEVKFVSWFENFYQPGHAFRFEISSIRRMQMWRLIYFIGYDTWDTNYKIMACHESWFWSLHMQFEMHADGMMGYVWHFIMFSLLWLTTTKLQGDRFRVEKVRERKKKNSDCWEWVRFKTAIGPRKIMARWKRKLLDVECEHQFCNQNNFCLKFLQLRVRYFSKNNHYWKFSN